MRVASPPVSTVVLIALVAASAVLGVVDGHLSPPRLFVLGSRKIASSIFLDRISKVRGTDKSTPGLLIDSSSSSNQAPTASLSSSSPPVPAGSDLDFRLAVLARYDQQPKSSFEAYLISMANLPTSFGSLASSSSFKFATAAAAAAANVDSKIADDDHGPVEAVEASPIGDDTEEHGLAAPIIGNGALAVVCDDGMGALASKKEESQVSVVMFAGLHTCTCTCIVDSSPCILIQ